MKLRKDFNIELPPLPDDWEEVSLYKYFNSVANAGGKLNWSVKFLALIGLFSFYKIVMHQDLEANEPVISKHPIISALAGEPPEQGIVVGSPIDEKELDSIREPDRMFHILDADSSQQVCIELARQGQSFVLHGPPGTGKSQTISNIIAEFIESGKIVLFISEKMAALEVVFKRLREAGLGDFCLELHSHKTNKREVIKELNRSLEERIVPKKSISEIEFQRLLQLRDKLNNYVTALHKIREPLGISVFNALSKLVSLRNVQFVSVNIPNIDALTPGRIVEFEELVAQLKNVWGVAEEGKNFPWYGYQESRITLELKSELSSLLERLLNLVEHLKSLSNQYASSVGLDSVLSLSEVEWLVKIGNLLSQSPETSPKWLIGEELDNLIKEATQYQELFNSYQITLNSLQKKYDSRFFELPVDFTSHIEEAWSQTSNLFTTFDFNGAELLTHHAIILEFVKDTKTCIKQWLNDVRNLARYLGFEIDNLSLERIKQIGKLSLLCCSHTRPETNWFDPIFLQNVKNILPKARESYVEYKHKKQSIMEQYYETIFELDLDRLAQCYSGNYRTLFDLLMPAFFHPSKQDAKTITTYHKTEQNYTAAMFSAPQSYKEDTYRKGIEFLQVFERFQQLSRDLLVSAYELLQILGVQVDHTNLEKIRDLARLVIQTGEVSCEAEWLDPVRLKQVGALLPTIKNDYLDFKKSKEKLMENYDESFLEMDLDTLIEKYNSAYKRLFRLLKPSYYKDQKAIARTTRSGNIPTSLKKDLLAARELKRHAIRLEKEREQTAQILGRLFQGILQTSN